MKRTVIVVAILVVLAGGGALFLRNRGKPDAAAAAAPAGPVAVPVQVATVERADLTATLEATGTILPLNHATLASKIGGRVAKVYVRESDRVRAGQVVVELEAAEARARVAQAEAALQVAQARVGASQARLAALRAGARPQEVRQAEEAVRAARSTLDNAESELHRMEVLFASSAVSQQDVDRARWSYQQASALYQGLSERLGLLQAGARAEDITAAEEDVKQAEAGVAQAAAGVHAARIDLDGAFIRSPIAGVVADRLIEPGEAVMMGTNVVTVVDEATLVLRAEVSEQDVARLALGQRATVTVDGLGAAQFAGTVSQLHPAADPMTRMFTVDLALHDPTRRLQVGRFGRAVIATEQRPGVLVIPRRAVPEAGEAIVFVVKGDTVERRPITVGLRQGDRLEVVSGLTEGEQVVIEGQAGLSDGARVRVVAGG